MGRLSRSAVEILLRRAGLTVSQAEIEELQQAWFLLEPILELVRAEGRDPVVEPAQIFRADAWNASTDDDGGRP
ncbi:MAG: hypothetical protein BGO82_05190 [Devosia sp. 67-54]|uniref:hypothetical protein n=1 Tax=unclassified Devosia TaxID=196773 RepID=UPI000967F62B|nr:MULTISPECIES: hypothetical protein [unclassified Devosia]MBN9306991.1 hypothetical protein [Devosia sp.]OJX16923.1 MAG: hypothetical protein BGO82_05190 [Devosia sp. 67-54]